MQLEKHMLEEDVTIPVYFAHETDELIDMYYSMEQTSPSQQKARSAAEGNYCIFYCIMNITFALMVEY